MRSPLTVFILLFALALPAAAAPPIGQSPPSLIGNVNLGGGSRFSVNILPNGSDTGQLFTYVDNTGGGICTAASVTDCYYISSTAHQLQFYTNGTKQATINTAGVVGLNTANYASCTALTTNASAAIGCTTSDRRLKNDQGVIAGPAALAAVLAIAPHGFTYKDPQLLGSDGRQHFGFFAQDVRRRFPQLVSTGPATHLTPGGTLHLDKGELLAVAWAAIRQQQHEIAGLKASIRSLESARRSHP